MKIGYDAKRAVNNNTGLGNYSRLVISTIAATGDDRLLLYAPELRNNPRLMTLLDYGNVEMRLPDTVAGKRMKAWWRSFGMVRQMRCDELDLFHGLSNELPLNIRRAGIPSVVTIHDVIFRHFPDCYAALDRAIYDYKFRKAAHNATRVIAISECTRRDIIDAYHVDPAKIDVVYQGCHPQFSAPVSDERRLAAASKYKLDRPYIIGVGTVEQRKNQLLTVKALRGLPDDIVAVIVGRRTKYARLIDEYAASHNLTDRVVFLENADFRDFPVLYANALLSSYPSRYEGFGLPVIESLSAGTPVIIATGSCLEEAGGSEAPAVAPDDVDAFVGAACRLIDDHDYRTAVVEAGQRHIQQFSQENFARGLRDSYSAAIENFRQ